MPAFGRMACAICLQVFTATAFPQQGPAITSSVKTVALHSTSCTLHSTLLTDPIVPSVKPSAASATPALLAQLSSQPLPAVGVTPECAPPPPPTNPEAAVSYETFIPQDHISGPPPTLCSPITGYIYIGDRLSDPIHASPYSYRAAQLVYLYPNSGTSQDPYSGSGNGDTGYTRQFYLPSPVNGQYITDPDYDGVTNDCYKWTGDGHAVFGQSGNYANVTTNPGSSNIVLNLAGQVSDPLQVPSVGAVRWNLSVTVNKTNGNNTHAFVSGAVSCYPSHRVFVGGIQIGYYNAPINPGITYIANCLAFNGPSSPLKGPGTASGGASVPVY